MVYQKITTILLIIALTINPAISNTTGAETSIEKDDTRGYAVDYDIPNALELYDVEALLGFIWFTEFNKSKIWKLNPETDELTSIEMPEGITPLFIKKAPDDTLWFLDYDFLPQNETDYVGRYNPADGNLTLLPLPEFAHPISFEVYENVAFVSILNMDMILQIQTDTFVTKEIVLDCEESCGPAGIDADINGNLWIADTLGNKLVKYDTISEIQTFYDFPNKVRSPAYIRITDENILWTGTHAQDRLVRVDLSDMSFTQYISPQPSAHQYPISGVNDIEISDNGDIWFAEHFINRIGRLHLASGTVHEYLSPRSDPFTSMILLSEDRLWYPDSNGILGYIDLLTVPTVSISKITTQYTTGREHIMEVEVSYLSGIYDEIVFDFFGEVRNIYQFSVTGEVNGIRLQRGQTRTYTFNLVLEGDLIASTYDFLIGINATTFLATQQFPLVIENDLHDGNLLVDNWELVVLAGMSLLAIYVYRVEIKKFIDKLKK